MPIYSVGVRRGPLRRSVSEHPPSDEDEEPENHAGRNQWTPAQGGPDGRGGADFDAIEAQEPSDGAGARLRAESSNGISPEAHLHGQPRNPKDLVDPAGRPRPVAGEGAGGEKTSPGPQAWQIHDNVVPRPPDLNIFSIDGETKVGEDFERKAHSAKRSGGTVRGGSSRASGPHDRTMRVCLGPEISSMSGRCVGP